MIETAVNATCGHERDWPGLYRRDYDLSTPDSIAHPAKASWDLAFRILKHLHELGLVDTETDTILDPMCGTARFLIAACTVGYKKAIGVELEPRFVAMARANVAYASKQLGRELDITIIQGDSRNLSSLLQERGLICCTSPPYQTSEGINITRLNCQTIAHSWAVTNEQPRKEGYGATEGQIGAMPDRSLKTDSRCGFRGHYGDPTDQRNIGNLPDKPMVGITSPPFLDAQKGGGISACMRGEGSYPLTTSLPGNVYQPSEHGSSPGQIGALPDRSLISITSPPYEDSEIASNLPTGNNPVMRKKRRFEGTWQGYGETEGQIGQEQSESYLEAMQSVFNECAKICDVICTVTKNPTRKGKLRDLATDTRLMLERAGFRIVCHHHAILFTEQIQGSMLEGTKKRVKGRMSFFKRLQWQRDNSEIADHEDVIIAVRDNGEGLCCLTSPPYGDSEVIPGNQTVRAEGLSKTYPGQIGYGTSPGQIGNLKDRP